MRKIHKKTDNFTILSLTDKWEPLLNYCELTQDQQAEAVSYYGEYAEESSYFIAEETVYNLSDFTRIVYKQGILTEFHAFASHTNLSVFYLKFNNSNDAVKLFIAY